MGFRSVIRTFVPSMKTIYLDQLTECLAPCVATIGFFDGVHLGHRYLIDKVVERAHYEGLMSTVVTFARHPRQVLSPDWHPQLISTFEEKVALLSQTDIDQLVVLDFDASMATLSAYDFMHDVLLLKLGVKVLVTGYDNHFGHRQTGSTEGFDDYVGYGRDMGMTVLQGDSFDVEDIRVSSSKVRRLLAEHIGTGLGYPTANLMPSDKYKLIPAAGVYAVRARVGDSPKWKPGMMNIGNRPTFGGDHLTLETHLFRFEDNIYGQPMTVSFVSRLRSESRFDSREALMEQLSLDARQAERILNEMTEIQ